MVAHKQKESSKTEMQHRVIEGESTTKWLEIQQETQPINKMTH